MIKPVYSAPEVYGRQGSAHLFSRSALCFYPLPVLQGELLLDLRRLVALDADLSPYFE